MIGYPAEKSVFLSGFVQGQGQKSEQKHETKKLVEFHNQPTSINYGHSNNRFFEMFLLIHIVLATTQM